MGFSFPLVAVKELRKKKKKKKKKKVRTKAVEFKGIKRSRRRRVVVKSDSKLTGIENIPDDLLMDILARLPAKVVTRSLCVSNLWHSLISSPHFNNLYIASPSSAKPKRFIFSIVGRKNQFRLTFLTSSLPHDDHDDMSVLKLDQVLDLPGMAGSVVNALHGLLCVRLGRRIQICNLTTYQQVALPMIESELLDELEYDIWNFFGYDSVHGEYKVLNIVTDLRRERSEQQVLTLGAQASWRNTKGNVFPHRPYAKGIFFKNVLYYEIWVDPSKCAIMSFDFASEDFKLIELPVDAGIIWNSRHNYLTNYKDKIAVFIYDNIMHSPNISFNLWVMEDLKKMEWSKNTMVLPVYQMNFFKGYTFGMRGTGNCNEVLLGEMVLSLVEPLSFIYFDLEKKKITKRLQIKIDPMLVVFVCEDEVNAGMALEMALWENIANIMYLEI